MSLLQQSIDQRSIAEPVVVPCAVVQSQTSGVIIYVWQIECWVLPWSRFESARLVGTGEQEQLILAFANHHVTATGANLRGLLDDIAGFRIGCLRDLPPEYRAKAKHGAPFIARLAVRSLNE